MMNIVTKLLFRIGLACGLIAVFSALALIPSELGYSVLAGFRDSAEQLFSIFGLAFMWIGLALLVAAVVWLWRSWSKISDTTKVVSVLGLLAGTFVGAYVFHWLFPKTLGVRPSA